MTPQMNESFYIIEEGQEADVYLNGPFLLLNEIPSFTEQLRTLHQRVPVARVWIDSPGGAASTMVSIREDLIKIEYLITITTSYASSAGSFIWACGDTRVVSPAATIMIHREGFYYGGKVQQHENHISCVKEIFEPLFTEVVGEIIDEECMEAAKITEVFKSGKYFIDRGVAISYEQFCNNRDKSDVIPIGTVMMDGSGNQFLVTPDSRTRVDIDQFTVNENSAKSWLKWFFEHDKIETAPEAMLSTEDNKDNTGYTVNKPEKRGVLGTVDKTIREFFRF